VPSVSSTPFIQGPSKPRDRIIVSARGRLNARGNSGRPISSQPRFTGHRGGQGGRPRKGRDTRLAIRFGFRSSDCLADSIPGQPRNRRRGGFAGLIRQSFIAKYLRQLLPVWRIGGELRREIVVVGAHPEEER
jgi:hypothetical protein